MLNFDIDWSSLARVGFDLGASEKQIRLSLNRALRRTEASLRRLSSKGLSRELQLRTSTALRKRLKSMKLKKVGGLSNGNGVGLWYGLNEMPIGVFKGRPRKTADGAAFRSENFKGGFIGKSKISGRRSIFKRSEKRRLPIAEQLYPVHDKAVVFIEDEVFDKTEDIFWQHFERDLRARIKFRVGKQ